MSSNQNNEGMKKVGSISRRLTSRVILKKLGTQIGLDLLFFFLGLFIWLMAMERAYTGKTVYELGSSVDRSLNIGYYNDTTIDSDLGKGMIEWIDARFEAFDTALVYRVSAKDKSFAITVPAGRAFCEIGTIVFAILCLQIIGCLLSIISESKRVKKVLEPINLIARRADELAKLEFSDEKYHALEAKITSLDPEDSLTLTQSDKELLGIEEAINNLLTRMREANMQQARFVNDASHELRTPIAVIEGYSNMLARWGREDEEVLNESITAIQHESAHMKYLVEQLLFLARGDSGKTVLHIENASLSDMMREIYEESLMIDENHIYRFKAPAEDIRFNFDAALLKQAVRILVDNAAKYTKEHDEITISVGLNEEGAPYLQVQDTGIGMAESDVAHMFERFYRSDEVRNYKGTGLGLSIAKWIVDKHKGHFEIVSRTDLGTRIRIVLKSN